MLLPDNLRPVALAGLAGVLIAITTLTGCAGTSPAPPASTSPPSVASASNAAAPKGPSYLNTRLFEPRKLLFDVAIPQRFVDAGPSSPEATAIPALAQSIRSGGGALALDRQSGATFGSGYTPTIAGLCSVVKSQNLAQLAAEAQKAITSAATPGTAHYEILPEAAPYANQRVSGTYEMSVGGRGVHVQQVGALAGPGKACILTYSTDDPTRDANDLETVRDTFNVDG